MPKQPGLDGRHRDSDGEIRRKNGNMRSKLRPGASCLFVIQYRNSDFTRMQALPNTKVFSDGFLIDSLRGHSFYALISPDNLTSLVKRAGFQIEERLLNDGSVYLWAKSPERSEKSLKFEIVETPDDFRIVGCK